jgi:transposase InsO family protein
MHCHANARLTPQGRATVFLLVEAGMTVTAACLAARVSGRFYRPQTNGKCERWIRTVLTECLYREAFAGSVERRRSLERFVSWYNEVRPHLGIGGRTPRQRLREKLAA